MMNSETNETQSVNAGADACVINGQSFAGEVPETAPTSAVVPEIPSAEELADLRATAAKATENWDRYVRVVADLDNFRKRAAREKQEAIRYANEALMSRLITVLDNFDMALAAANAPTGAAESLKEGVAMIANQLKAVLAEAGLEEVDATGQVFDPNWHEAVSQVESADIAEGHVAQQVRKGYKLKDRLLRAASVVVAKAPGGAPSGTTA